MKHLKVNVGRKRLSSEYIQSKQDFAHVLKGAKAPKNTATLGKSFWFYGVTGLASVAAIVGYQFFNSNKHVDETIITLENPISPELAVNDQVQEFAMNVAAVAAYSSNSDIMYSTSDNNASKSNPTKMKQVVSREDEMTVKVNDVDTKSEQVIVSLEVEKGEVEPTKVAPKAVRNMLPSISGVFNGDILFSSFKNGEIHVGETFTVKQYSIQYTSRKGDKIISVTGSQIPADVSAELESLGINQTIFITNVIAVDNSGEMIRSVAMDLNVKFN